MQRLAIALCVFAIRVAAANIYTFDLLPASGDIQGAPGTMIGWGYSIQNDSTDEWLVTTGLNTDAFVHATPNLIFDFPIVAPGATVTVPFDLGTHAGLYEVTLDSSAPAGFVYSGDFALNAQWWTGDPLAGGSFASLAADSSQPYSLRSAATPEPARLGLAGTVLLALAIASTVRRRERKAKKTIRLIRA